MPSAKLVGKEKYSIISDYIGKPTHAYNSVGDLVWSAEYDIYGDLRNFEGDKHFIPFRQLGQYEDVETGLYYNRFRYYSPETGTYISQDPIGLAGGNPNIYSYVANVNLFVDVFGLYEIVLGLSFNKYNQALAYDLRAAGTNAYSDGDWGPQKISKYINQDTFVGEFDKVVKNADVIHFSLAGLEAEQVKKAGLNFEVVDGKLKTGSVTSVELNKILNDDALFNKTIFYETKDGSLGKTDKSSVKKRFH